MEVDDPLLPILFEGQPAKSDKRGAFSWRRIQVLLLQQPAAYGGNGTKPASFSYFHFHNGDIL